MKILIENLKPGVSQFNKESYFTFWVKFWDPKTDMWFSVSGWRYWPARRTLSTPAMHKGGQNYSNTTKVSKSVYNQILLEIERVTGADEVEELAAA